MPILDSKTKLSDAAALTGTGANNSSSYDFGAPIKTNVGTAYSGGDDDLTVRAQVSAVTGTSPTVVFKLQDSADDSSFADILTLPSQTLASGMDVQIPVPLIHRRYLRLVTTMGGTSPTCTLSAWIVSGEQVHTV